MNCRNARAEGSSLFFARFTMNQVRMTGKPTTSSATRRPSDDRLLDGLVAAHLHADARRDARVGKEARHEKTRARALLAHEKSLLSERPRPHLPAFGMHMIGARNDDVRMIADGGLLHGQFPGRPAGERQIKRIGFKGGEDRGAVAHFQPYLDRRVCACEGAQRLRRKILGGADDSHRHTPAVEASQ